MNKSCSREVYSGIGNFISGHVWAPIQAAMLLNTSELVKDNVVYVIYNVGKSSGLKLSDTLLNKCEEL